MDFSSEAFLAGHASDELSRTSAPGGRFGARGGDGQTSRDGSSRTVHHAGHVPSNHTGAESVSRYHDNTDKTAVIACYDRDGVAPRIETVEFIDPASYIDVVSLAVMSCVSELGGGLTPEVIYELIANLSHADFANPIISILDAGDTIRVADGGPGIPDKSAAMRPGFTSASLQHRGTIRGVGAGLPLVRSLVEPLGGFLVIDDNIGGGTVVTASVNEHSPNRYSPIAPLGPSGIQAQAVVPLKVDGSGPIESRGSTPADVGEYDLDPFGHGGEDPAAKSTSASSSLQPSVSLITSSSSTVRGVPLSDRQREVLAVVADSLEAGPSTVSSLLDIPLSTAYRDLRFLEDRGLVASLGSGKRQVTGMGMELLRVY